MPVNPAKVHEDRVCAVCLGTFKPPPGEKGRKQRTCSHACAGQARTGKRYGGVTKGYGYKGRMDGDGCRCSSCKAGRVCDRTALAAKVAAEMGVQVSPDFGKPTKRWSVAEVARRAELVREGLRARDIVLPPRWAR